MNGLDQDLIVFEGGKRICFKCEGGIGARQLREIGRLIGENPLAGLRGERHGSVCWVQLL